MRFPVGDWQFWVATAAFVMAMLWLFRGVLPWARAKRRRRAHRATLTVGGRPVER